jgi:glycosyltransferase involved in cell wall biosynthesis
MTGIQDAPSRAGKMRRSRRRLHAAEAPRDPGRPTVSIAVPVLGQANFLPSGLASLVSQDAALDVAILDATPDESVQQLLGPVRERLVYNRHGRDRGQAAAIAEGWRNTRGEIVGWLCADDILFPDALRSVLDVFQQHPEVDVVYGDSVIVSPSGEFLGYFPSITEDVSELRYNCCISQPACFIRRRALDAIGGLNEELVYIMDWDLWTRLWAAGRKFFYLRLPLAAVRSYEGTKTSSRSTKRYAEILRHLKRHASTGELLTSLLNFYLYDLSSHSHGMLDRLKLRLTRRTTLLLTHYRGITYRPPPILYGLEHGTGRIVGSAVVHLPWYEQVPPHQLCATIAGEGGIEMTLRGEQLAPRLEEQPDGVRKLTVELPPLRAQHLELHLRATEPQADVRLVTLRVA